MMKRIGGYILVSVVLSAQQSGNRSSFEVASVKLASDEPGLPSFLKGPSELRMRFQGGPGTKSPDRLNCIGVTLRMLIRRAYNVLPEQVTGPDWLDTQRYTIAAKLPPETTLEESSVMLQNLLKERFQLRLHREARGFPVYHLAISKHGAKLKPAEKVIPISDKQELQAALQKGLAANRAMRESLGSQATDWFHLSSATMAEFIERLSQYLDRPAIDRTQVSGPYSFSLHWVADAVKARADAPQGPSLFAALEEQLGLELRPGTDRLEVLVVDAADRIPTGN